MDLSFKRMVELSLDKDIAELFTQGRINTNEAMQLQELRIARGRAFFMTTTATGVEGWTPDGVKWYPTQPGNGREAGEKL